MKLSVYNVALVRILTVFILGFLLTQTISAVEQTELCYLDNDIVDEENREVNWSAPPPDQFLENQKGEYDAVWIAYNRVNLWNCPKKTSDKPQKILSASAVFGQRFFLSNRAVYFGGDEERWYLLSDQTEANSTRPVHIGWVKGAFLLKSKFPLKNESNQISYKALIHKSLTPGTLYIPVRFSPGNDVKEVGDLQLKQQFYIYDISAPKRPNLLRWEKSNLLKDWLKEINSAQPIHQSEKKLQNGLLKDVHVLVGDTPLLNVRMDKLGRGLLGWISAKAVRLWNTREGLEFSGPVRIYKNTRFSTKAESINTDLEYSHITPRHPVLQSQKTPLGDLFRVGLFNRMTPKMIRKKLNNITIPLDVLFVIDGTKSMKAAFHDTKAAVRHMAETLNVSAMNQLIPPPWFGLAVYRDKPGASCSSDAALKEIDHPVSLQAWESNGKFERELGKLQAKDCQGDRDYEESLYKGLYEGVLHAGFREGSYRAIIHLGDDGDHGRNVALEQVAEIFRLNRVNYFPIFYNTKFHKRDRISSSFNKSVKTLPQIIQQTKDAKHYLNTTPTDIKKQIIDALQRVSKSQARQQKEIRNLEKTLTNLASMGIGGKGDWIDLRMSKGWNWEKDLSPQMKDYILKSGLSIKDAINIYHEGWVSRVPGKDSSIQSVVLVDYYKLLTLQTVINSLIQSRPTPKNIFKTWRRILAQLTGDLPCDETMELQVCLKQLSGVHFNLGILKYSLAELSRLLETNHRRFAELRCESKAKNVMISGILEEKDYQVSYSMETGNCVVSSKHQSRRQYWFPAGDTKLAWIPISKLP